jgi:hypothetical protein
MALSADDLRDVTYGLKAVNLSNPNLLTRPVGRIMPDSARLNFKSLNRMS